MDVTWGLNPNPRAEKAGPNRLGCGATKILVKVKFIKTQNKASGGR